MKKTTLIAVMVAVLGIVTMAQATLIDRGPDTLGNHLIYDTDLNITWYDYTKGEFLYGLNWNDTLTWAANLTVNMTNGQRISDWRLPTSAGKTWGSTNEGEMGHLYYDELGNIPLGNYALADSWNQGPFTNLISDFYFSCYWTGTELPFIKAWSFSLGNGYQYAYNKVGDPGILGIAVRDNDVGASVPEPATALLLITGSAGIAALRRRMGRRS